MNILHEIKLLINEFKDKTGVCPNVLFLTTGEIRQIDNVLKHRIGLITQYPDIFQMTIKRNCKIKKMQLGVLLDGH